MTTTFENSKGYKVLPLSADEIKVWPRAKTCDRCGRKISSNGFYVGAVNLMYCPDCYEEWHASAPENREFWISGKIRIWPKPSGILPMLSQKQIQN